jgi:endonuclease/exonuclease/phosphatase (EEP) superfamily protein YafD
MRHMAALVRLAGWAIVAGLGLLALLRVVAWDAGYPILLGLHGLGPLPYLAAMPVAVVALARKRLVLGLVALAVAAVIVPTGLPEVAARDSVPASARTAPRLRILSWNVYEANSDAAAMDRVIRKADADIVVLQEVSASNIAALRVSPALAGYLHSYTSPQPSAFGAGMWSRFPLEEAGEFNVGGLPMTRAVVQTSIGPVRLVNVHALSPVNKDGLVVWPRQLRSLAEEARRPGPPIVLAGDFNATWGHRPFRRLLDAGLEDAAAARGSAWAPTWPAGDRLLRQPALRLDHVLTGPGLVATRYATGPAGGSDHRSIVAEIAVRPARA